MNPATHEAGEHSNANGMLATIAAGEMMWAPYRAACDAFLRTSRNGRALLAVNRKLGDELLDIVRRQQDLVHELSEKMLSGMSKENAEHISTKQYQETFEEISNAALHTLRELSSTFADVQAKSVTAFRDQLHAISEHTEHQHAEAAE